MSYNFDGSSFSLDHAGLELSLNDLGFDATQAREVQQHLQQQQQQLQRQQQLQQEQQHQQQLQNLFHNDPSQQLAVSIHAQSMGENNTVMTSPVGYDFQTSSLSVDMMNAVSTTVTTAPIFQAIPNNNQINGANLSPQTLQLLQQQRQQQQLLMQQQQQQQRQQQQQQQQSQQFQQLPQAAHKDAARQHLLTPSAG
ncbi:hypothetical protein BGX31_006580, partial [Mortierella sp. GBA43]